MKTIEINKENFVPISTAIKVELINPISKQLGGLIVPDRTEEGECYTGIVLDISSELYQPWLKVGLVVLFRKIGSFKLTENIFLTDYKNVMAIQSIN